MSTSTRPRGKSKRSAARPRKRLSAAERREVIERAATEVFAERGYTGASIDEIARRSGVSPPVVYDHFASKQDLHRRLLERTRDELLEMWREHLFTDEAVEISFPQAIEAWALYVEKHPYAARMFFRETTGEPEVEAFHAEIQEQARVALGVIAGRLEGTDRVAGAGDEELQMTAEIFRSGLTGLAVWWIDHPEIARERIVAAVMNLFWLGFDRVRRGEMWAPDGS